MGKKGGARDADRFVVPLESFPELHHQPLGKELTHLGQLRVDDCCTSCKYGREGQRSGLRLHDAPAKQAASSN